MDNLIQKLKIIFKDSTSFQLYILTKFSRIIPTKCFLRRKFLLQVGYPLNFDHPQTFNEKLQWLKLYDRRLDYITMVDKYMVKDYVACKIGMEHIIPTYGVYDSFDEIDFDKLPHQFVLKCTHDSGGLVICKDKSSLNKDMAKKKLHSTLERNYYWAGREWPYKDVERKIIAEKLIGGGKNEPRDYKIFCFNGQPRIYKIDVDRFTNHRANYYTTSGELLPFDEVLCPRCENVSVEIPSNMDEMLEIARKLSEGIPFVRVDLYNIDGAIFFGELTFYPASGFGVFAPPEWDLKIGDMLKLPTKSN